MAAAAAGWAWRSKGEIKKKWGQLTDDEIDQINGSYDKMVGKLQEKYGYDQERAKQEVTTVYGRYYK
jgi:uncharacterized protein YjbJ (UPF0337 family)